MDRKITIELMSFGQIKEYRVVSPVEAREYLDKEMTRGHRWRIQPPNQSGELPNDEARYAEDCKACGVGNPFDV
jgi:hypothetical protein